VKQSRGRGSASLSLTLASGDYGKSGRVETRKRWLKLGPHLGPELARITDGVHALRGKRKRTGPNNAKKGSHTRGGRVSDGMPNSMNNESPISRNNFRDDTNGKVSQGKRTKLAHWSDDVWVSDNRNACANMHIVSALLPQGRRHLGQMSLANALNIHRAKLKTTNECNPCENREK